jgi:hypothetical protein
MILSSFFTVLFVFMAFYGALYFQRTVARYVVILFYAAATFFIWNPFATNLIANYFGIGRGLDLFLMLFSLIIINVIFIMARHLFSMHQQITKLARYIAIRDARNPVCP